MTSGKSDGAGDPAGDEQRRRADDTIRAISNGADPAEQAFQLSNRFTDDWTRRAAARVRRMLGRPTKT